MKNHRRWSVWTLSAAAAWGISSLAFAQDPIQVVPNHYKVLQENDQMRMLDIRLAPGEKAAMHSHPDYVIYNITPGKVRFTAPDGKTKEIEFKAGESRVAQAESHAVENIGDTECHVLNIELKKPYGSAPVQHVAWRAGELQWQDAPAGLPPGAQMAVLSGDPSKPGPFTVRLKAPADYKIKPHWHPAVENVTIISGTMSFGMGDDFDETKTQPFPAGSFTSMPAGMHHYALTKEACVIQLHGIGPWAINYINSTDDPRNAPAREKLPVRGEEQ